MNSATPPCDDDPPPVPPARPTLHDCCHGGCDPCVFDLYEEALEHHGVALAAWQDRRSRKEKGGAG